MIAGILLLTGNMSFSLDYPDIDRKSKCQSFISDVFAQYGLMPTFVKAKPNISITTIPVHIPQKIPSTKKMKLVFKGKTLKDGKYTFTIGEMDPVLTQNAMLYYHMYGKETPSLTHTFVFSPDCQFQEYLMKKRPPKPVIIDANNRGFYVTADSTCAFAEPHPRGEDSLTVHFDFSTVGGEYKTLKYPNYYRGLCALAKKTITD